MILHFGFQWTFEPIFWASKFLMFKSIDLRAIKNLQLKYTLLNPNQGEKKSHLPAEQIPKRWKCVSVFFPNPWK